MKPYLKKTHHKKVLVELLKVKALSSNPSPANKEKKICFLVNRNTQDFTNAQTST
jgi:hypothetical protein